MLDMNENQSVMDGWVPDEQQLPLVSGHLEEDTAQRQTSTRRLHILKQHLAPLFLCFNTEEEAQAASGT